MAAQPVTVTVPTHPPALTPVAARALLAILLDMKEPGMSLHDNRGDVAA